MKTFKVHLNLCGKWDDPDVFIRNVESLQLISDTVVLVNNSFEIDFGNEIFSIGEVS